MDESKTSNIYHKYLFTPNYKRFWGYLLLLVHVNKYYDKEKKKKKEMLPKMTN